MDVGVGLGCCCYVLLVDDEVPPQPVLCLEGGLLAQCCCCLVLELDEQAHFALAVGALGGGLGDEGGCTAQESGKGR